MAFFKKKKSSGNTGGDPYPKQPAYPVQPSYPVQQPMYPVQQPMYPGQQPMYPGQQPYPQTSVPPPPYTPTQEPPNQQPPVAVFDQTASIDPNKPVNIPPPPPGYAPTAAQQAHAQGTTVHVTRQKKDFWGGGSNGGVSFGW